MTARLSPLARTAVLGCALLLPCVGCRRTQAQVPTEIAAAPCSQAPRIDGRLAPGEWDAATHLAVPLAMVQGGGLAGTREAELWAMNSAKTLYLAFRVPDAERQVSLSPVLSDLFLLAFARGAQLAPGDDRKLLIPGAYADKHLTAPGQDADDAQRDGQGVLGWYATQTGGEYIAEYAVPLATDDAEDVNARPGERVRMNLVYADGFQPEIAKAQIGGLYGPSADDATAWGSILLAANVGEEKPAPEPEWATRLFPHTGPPGESGNRLSLVAAEEISFGAGPAGQVTCEFLYRGVDGTPTRGGARVFLPPVALTDPAARVPLVYAAGYELDAGGAGQWLARGMAVATPHAEPLNPAVRGPNLDTALLHALRAAPFVDNGRVLIQGGSAGGYMTLMLAAETFPLVCALPDVPPVSWAYEAAYFLANRELARAPGANGQTAMPVLTAVIPLAEQTLPILGEDYTSDPWLYASPLWHLETITAPLQVTLSTADMLVPIDQAFPDLAQAPAPGLFPPEFTMAVDTLIERPEARRTLAEALPADRYELFRVTPPEGVGRVAPTAPQPVEWKPLDLPFSREKQWSIVVIDEGGPEPDVGHLKLSINPNRVPYIEWALQQGVRPEQLTETKLGRLMMRLQGNEYLPTAITPATGPAFSVVRLDFPAAERADVLAGLRAFAADDACALRLAEVYGRLPAELRALGATLGAGTAESIRSALAALE